MAQQSLNFTKQEGSGVFEASFIASGDFHLHVEFLHTYTPLYISTRSSDEDRWSKPDRYEDNPFDRDMSFLIYPKAVRLVCTEQPLLAHTISKDESSDQGEAIAALNQKFDEIIGRLEGQEKINDDQQKQIDHNTEVNDIQQEVIDQTSEEYTQEEIDAAWNDAMNTEDND